MKKNNLKPFDSEDYLRIGTSYYKFVNIPLVSGDSIKILVPWSRKVIAEDYGSKVLDEIEKFDGFCNIPDHLNFQPVINNHFNRYQKIEHQPNEDNLEITKEFLKHIFGDHLELALDYLTLLYTKPIQALPVLCLVSHERGTGKTTFLNFLKLIYGPNMTYNKNEDFRSQFNSDWAGKLIIAVDEVLLDKREDSERIKNLSTAKTFKAEAKGKDRSEVEFFGKFILCSNNEDNFIQIDPGETRYWVLKVPVFEKENVFLLDQLKKEIPGFLHFLVNRKLSTEHASRMWFDPRLLKTEALRKVAYKNRSRVEVELLQILSDLITEYELEEIHCCLKDLLPFLRNSNIYKCNRSDIKNILNDRWSLRPENNSNSYTRYCIDKDGYTYSLLHQKGRYYTISKAFVDEKMRLDE